MSITVSACLIMGAIVFLLAGIGVLRFPDVYLRMQASSKGSTLGIALILLATSLHFGTVDVTLRALLVVAFLYGTVPVSTHIVAKATYYSGITPWHGSAAEDDLVEDELKQSLEE